KNGIYTKLCELSVLCDVNVAFLEYTGPGKPSTFGSPSFHAVIQELCKLYNNMMDGARAEEAKATEAAASVGPLPEDAWWKVPLEEVKDQEEMKQLLERFEGLYEKLCYGLAARSERNDTAENDK
ncbi:hypothetical protein CARUB_v10002787mg, partial [Capsella rubella]